MEPVQVRVSLGLHIIDTIIVNKKLKWKFSFGPRTMDIIEDGPFTTKEVDGNVVPNMKDGYSTSSKLKSFQ